MATFLGKAGVVKVDANSVAEVRSFSVSQAAATAEDTVMGDEWASHKVTMKSWSGQLTCYWDDTDISGQGALMVGSEVNLKLYPEGAGTGDAELSGTAIITSVETQLSHDGVVEATFGFQGTGPLLLGTVV